mmetsp:Transcript_168118/g.539948  ORF Transcript_168118/g.539948 Transcript_168118/m.539948 type:complete len:851 (+) Transcript_168118:19-2571(+)
MAPVSDEAADGQNLESWSDWEAGAESEAPSTASEHPEDWLSDDEPPQDHVNDLQVCSRDGKVKKIIRRVGKGLERPGQYDVVQVRWQALAGTGTEGGNPGADSTPVELEIHMGEDQLPLAVEFAIKQMRVNEIVEVSAPVAYGNFASPLVGRKLRDRQGKLPKHGKVPRKFRFLPIAPRGLAIQAKASSSSAPADALVGDAKGGAEGEFRARVELLGIKSVHMLTEDRLVYKSVLTAGSGRRGPRRGDWVWFSIERTGGEVMRHSVELVGGDAGLPAPGLDHVLISMKDGERCIATLPGQERSEVAAAHLADWTLEDEAQDTIEAEGASAEMPALRRRPRLRRWLYEPPEVRKLELRQMPEVNAFRANAALMPGDTFPVSEEKVGADGVLFLKLADGRGWAFDRLPGPGILCTREEPLESLAPPQRLIVTLNGWRRKDKVPVPPSGTIGFRPDAEERCGWPMLQKLELRPGPERLPHEVEEGCCVLVGLRHLNTPDHRQWMLSWCMGEGSVPGYLEAAVASMRVFEVAQFDVPAAAVHTCTQIGPDYEGRSPLRRAELSEMDKVMAKMLEASPSEDLPPGAADSEEPDFAPVCLRDDWPKSGSEVKWEEEVGKSLGFDCASDGAATDTGAAALQTRSLRIILLAVMEGPDVGTLSEDFQRAYLERERAHGNALARLGRWAEASAAYTRALDAVRRTATYKRLFPTERGLIKGAYSRDAAEEPTASGAALLEGLDTEQRQAFNAGLVSLHLNLGLCASKQGRVQDAHRHASIVLGAEPDNAKALFRRGSASVLHGEYDEALKDLQRAAELQPQDRGIRDELAALHRKMKEHLAVQKIMFQKAFHPSSRKEV